MFSKNVFIYNFLLISILQLFSYSSINVNSIMEKVKKKISILIFNPETFYYIICLPAGGQYWPGIVPIPTCLLGTFTFNDIMIIIIIIVSLYSGCTERCSDRSCPNSIRTLQKVSRQWYFHQEVVGCFSSSPLTQGQYVCPFRLTVFRITLILIDRFSV